MNRFASILAPLLSLAFCFGISVQNGPLDEQDLSTSWNYDARRLLTSITRGDTGGVRE